MVDEQKVRRMTKMAFYESHGGKKDRAVARYFMGDYVGMHMLVSFLYITVAFLAVIGAYLCFYFEEVMAAIYTLDVVAIAKKILFYYVLALVIYLAVTYIVYRIRYRRSRKRLNVFGELLERLDPTEDKN